MNSLYLHFYISEAHRYFPQWKSRISEIFVLKNALQRHGARLWGLINGSRNVAVAYHMCYKRPSIFAFLTAGADYLACNIERYLLQ
jgi:hypothetical protein